MRVLDPGVGPERPRGRHLVRRVPRQEHPLIGVAFGDPLGRVPGGPPGDRHIEVRYADGPPDVRGAPFVGELLERLAVFGMPGRVEHPVLPVVDRQQRPVGVRAGEVADDEPPVADHVREIAGGEGDADVVEQVPGAVLPDAEPLPHGTARTVRGDQIVRPDGGVLTGLLLLSRAVTPSRSWSKESISVPNRRSPPSSRALFSSTGSRSFWLHRHQPAGLNRASPPPGSISRNSHSPRRPPGRASA
ncbi:hypothetical protein SHKM778_38740 [Streptomyces sp. KM77-8]|uniref:Uncharacterized protein n=1 Tax=Streptomyces haneummycinicus TaxID=3074435 RepID=A0AAT9HJ03_9ACTN